MEEREAGSQEMETQVNVKKQAWSASGLVLGNATAQGINHQGTGYFPGAVPSYAISNGIETPDIVKKECILILPAAPTDVRHTRGLNGNHSPNLRKAEVSLVMDIYLFIDQPRDNS